MIRIARIHRILAFGSIHAVWEVEGIVAIHSQRITRYRSRKRKPGLGPENATPLPAICQRPDQSVLRAGSRNLPKVIDHHAVADIKIRQPSPQVLKLERKTIDRVCELTTCYGSRVV